MENERFDYSDPKYIDARRRVRAMAKFYRHLFSYIIISAFFVAINLLTSPHSLWFYWPMLGWGIGLLSHAYTVFTGGKFGAEWEDRKVREIMERDKSE